MVALIESLITYLCATFRGSNLTKTTYPLQQLLKDPSFVNFPIRE